MADSNACSSSTSNSLLSTPMSFIMVVIPLILCALPTLFWLVTYLVPQLYMALRPVPDLAKKYRAEWALVTGAGSGIGKALAFKLASQNLNVVLVSLDDAALQETLQQIRQRYPQQQFRSVGVTFAPGVNYMAQIKQAVEGLEIPIIFSNAGFLVTGFMEQCAIDKLLLNMECNATSAVQVSHYFMQQLVSKKQKGCIVFTSSIAAAIPTPFSALYASTKAFVSTLAACLHVEGKPIGIDVCCIHPSPVASQFYDKLDHKVDMIEAAAKAAVTPESVVDDMFRSIGACAWRDLGAMAIGTRMGTFFVPMNFFAELFATAAPYLADWKKHNQHR